MAKKLIGPFKQIVTLSSMPLKGPLKDIDLEVIEDAGILTEDGAIIKIDKYIPLMAQARGLEIEMEEIQDCQVALPAFIDAHTHICFGGNRARDFALRNGGSTYLEILESGGGIMDTVRHTRAASESDLTMLVETLATELMHGGISTIEVKSGYGLSHIEEIKILNAINKAKENLPCEVIPTCLAAHIVPAEYKHHPEAYIEIITKELLPEIKNLGLAQRVDAFIEPSAFTEKLITPYLNKAKELGFDLTLHADQFTTGGSKLAIEYEAISADHLESSLDYEIQQLAKSEVIPVALPGASLGLGCNFTPARSLLDAGASLAIASDYNPGSAPMGDLLTQATILATFQKLSNAEVLAGMTYRAAAALGLKDRGVLEQGKRTDIVTFQTDHYSKILYRQGKLRPTHLFIGGQKIY